MNVKNKETEEQAPVAASGPSAPAQTQEPMFARIAIVGVGMMGGSLGLALRAKGLAQTVVGIDLSTASLARARESGAIDEGTTDLEAGVREANVVMLAAPVGAIPPLLEALVPLVRHDALITDIGSAKQHIVAAGERRFGLRFVGGHPMAGSPQGGVDAALPNLFEGAAWAITRSRFPETPEKQGEANIQGDEFALALHSLVRAFGARPVVLDSAQHDRLVALVSHLPHILSFAFADVAAGSPDPDAAARMAGSSYQDMMRVSTSDRAFWQEIFAANRTELLAALDAYEARLHQLRSTLIAPGE